jgi:plasmid rolling circle replication initiator protein Rep
MRLEARMKAKAQRCWDEVPMMPMSTRNYVCDDGLSFAQMRAQRRWDEEQTWRQQAASSGVPYFCPHEDGIDWRRQHFKAQALAKLYHRIGMDGQSAKVAGCGTVLNFQKGADGKLHLSGGNFCHDRLCPACLARDSRQRAAELMQVLTEYQARYPGTQYIFLTLTVRNCTASELSATLDKLSTAWNLLMKRRPVQRAVRGWFRAIEITRNNEQDSEWYGTFHPHIHAIFAVPKYYFRRSDGLYITHEQWRQWWAEALGVDYLPEVRVQATKGKVRGRDGKPERKIKRELAAALEAAKYAVKDADYVLNGHSDEENASIVESYHVALRGRRLIAYGGGLKTVKEELKAKKMSEVCGVGEDDRVIYVYKWDNEKGNYVFSGKDVRFADIVADDGFDDESPPGAASG